MKTSGHTHKLKGMTPVIEEQTTNATMKGEREGTKLRHLLFSGPPLVKNIVFANATHKGIKLYILLGLGDNLKFKTCRKMRHK